MRSIEDFVKPIAKSNFLVIDAEGRMAKFSIIGQRDLLEIASVQMIANMSFIYDSNKDITVKSRWYTEQEENKRIANTIEMWGDDLGAVDFIPYKF